MPEHAAIALTALPARSESIAGVPPLPHLFNVGSSRMLAAWGLPPAAVRAFRTPSGSAQFTTPPLAVIAKAPPRPSEVTFVIESALLPCSSGRKGDLPPRKTIPAAAAGAETTRARLQRQKQATRIALRRRLKSE